MGGWQSLLLSSGGFRVPNGLYIYCGTESNYCARCQTGGKRLADRVMSRLLKEHWPRDMDDL